MWTSEAIIERRLKEARKELDRIGEYQYALVNDRLDEAVDELRAIVLTHRGDAEGGPWRWLRAAGRWRSLRGWWAHWGTSRV